MNKPTEQDFSTHARSVFESHEFTEVLILVYRFISKAVVYGYADTLIVTPTHFIWSSQGKLVSSFPIDSHPQQRVSFHETLDMILTRDSFVRQYFHLRSSTLQEVVYEIMALQDFPE